MVFLGDFVESLVINTKSEGAILLLYEEVRGHMGGGGWTYETKVEVLVYECPKSFKLDGGE